MQKLKLQFPEAEPARYRAGKIQKLLITAILLLVATPVFAVEISLDAQIREMAVGQQFQVDILLNTDNKDINAIEGKIIFPKKLIELTEIKDGNSIINFWIDPVRNCVSNGVERPGEICFAGITPGGYSDKRGLIFSLVFQSTEEGQGTIKARDIKALLNDGEGTETGVTVSNLQFVISKQAPPPKPTPAEKKDIDMPEIFEPTVASDPTMFDGQYFLVFATQDKGSGIDHYEVCEGKRKCVVAESPYLLKNQSLDEKIIVKAIDKSGNERIVILPAQKPAVWYKNYLLLAIIILVMAIAYFVWKFLWRKRKR